MYQTYRSYTQQGLRFPEFLVKLYTHQLLRALAYVHSMSICHRDLKPHNLVVDSRKGILFLIVRPRSSSRDVTTHAGDIPGLWECQGVEIGRGQRRLHLFSVLQSPRIDLWECSLHQFHR